MAILHGRNPSSPLPATMHQDETELYVNIVNENSEIETKTLLHLGCGAGGNDYIFKKHFKVTGVDISEGMLEIARKINPEVAYYYSGLFI